MPLAVFPLVIRRWRPSGLVCDTYEAFPHIAEYLPEDVFNARVNAMKNLVRKHYPNVYPDTYLFICSVSFVIATVTFSIYARNLEISMWYPLLILLLPAFLAYWSARRRNTHYLKISKFHDKLQTLLKDMTREDITRQIKWDYRQVQAYDNSVGLHLRHPLSSYAIGLVIEAVQADPACDLIHETGDVLPSYVAAAQDVVLEVGPESRYDNLLAMREMDITDQQQILPMYDMSSSAPATTTTPLPPPPTSSAAAAPSPALPPPAYDEHIHPPRRT